MNAMEPTCEHDKKRMTSYTVSYNSENHWSVLTQMWGSSWPKVLPYCLLNVTLMITLILLDDDWLRDKNSIFKLSAQGHTFTTLVVSFLLVSRVNTCLNRYTQARECLSTMYREAREILQAACVLSEDDQDLAAKEWRHEVAYRCLILLKTCMQVLDFQTDKVLPWDIPELNGEEEEDVKQNVFMSPDACRYAHGNRSEWEEAMRVPIRIGYLLKRSIRSQKKRLKDPFEAAHENRMQSNIASFMSGYYGITKFLTTPVPFPLIQMTRTFLFLYTFTVPFVMLQDDSSDVAHCFIVFLLTYGFVGLEMVAIELDNPFGDDENDFDNNAMATTAYEDIYLTILDVDGREFADKLRRRMHNKPKIWSSPPSPTACSDYSDEQTRLLPVKEVV